MLAFEALLSGYKDHIIYAQRSLVSSNGGTYRDK